MDVDLAQLRALEAAATAGPWEVDAGGGGIVFSATEDEFDVDPYGVYGARWQKDAALIVFLRNNAAAMADEIETLRGENEALAEDLASAEDQWGDEYLWKKWDQSSALEARRSRLASRPEASS